MIFMHKGDAIKTRNIISVYLELRLSSENIHNFLAVIANYSFGKLYYACMHYKN